MSKTLTLLAIFLSVFSLTSPVLAQPKSRDKPLSNIVVPSDQVINHDYFAAADTIVISGTINGDTYLAAGNIIVDGTINGDLLAAGGNIDLRGKVKNARIIGGNITVSGSIDNNLSAGAGSVNIISSAKINGSLAGAGGSLNISGPVSSDANLAGGQIILSNSIEGDVRAAGNLTLTSGASILGNLTYWSNDQARIQPGAKVAGRINQNQPPDTSQTRPGVLAGKLASLAFTLSIINLVTYLILGLLILKFLPFFATRVVRVLSNQLWPVLAIGLIIIILLPTVALLLFITVLGIPLALLLLAVFFILIYVSKVLVTLAIGKKILGYFNPDISPGWALLAGILLYWLLSLIPIVGWLTALIFTTAGLGALFLERRDFLAQIKNKKLM